MLTDGRWTQVFAHANGVGCDGLSALMDPRNSHSAVKPRDRRSLKPWLQTATKAAAVSSHWLKGEVRDNQVLDIQGY